MDDIPQTVILMNHNATLQSNVSATGIPQNQLRCRPNVGDSSDSSSESDSGDSDNGLTWKRAKLSRKSSKCSRRPVGAETKPSSSDSFAAAARKFSDDRQRAGKPAASKFSVWSNVLAEQGLVDNLHSVGVVRPEVTGHDRGCEGYDYTLKEKYEGHTSVWKQDMREIHRRFGCKRTAKERLGDMPMLSKSKRPFEVKEDDSEEAVITAIATILREPKQDLIGRVVKILGKKKALELLSMTEDIEDAGGMMTVDGTRRRTPGGVFFLLLKTDSHIRQDEKDEIFEEDRKNQSKEKKRFIKSRRARQLGVGNATDSQTPKDDSLPTRAEIVLNAMDTGNTDDNGDDVDVSDKEPGEIDTDED